MPENKNTEVMQSQNSLIVLALQNNASIETLERLMALEERFNANKSKTAFYSDMSMLQSDIPDLMKTKKVNFQAKDGGAPVKYDYIPLGDINKKLKPYLKKYGFSYRFVFTPTQNGLIKCDCIVTHKDGHQESTSMEAARDESGKKNNIQSIGSTRTYLQRYTLIAAFGLSTVEMDNDGRTAAEPKKEVIPEPKKKITYPIEPQKPQIIHEAEDPKLSDPSWYIQNIESMVKEKELTDFMFKHQKKIESFKEGEKRLIGRIYQVQLTKLKGLNNANSLN